MNIVQGKIKVFVDNTFIQNEFVIYREYNTINDLLPCFTKLLSQKYGCITGLFQNLELYIWS